MCLRNLQDFQLAVALVRVVEGDESPMLRDILTTTVIPTAFKEGNRWLASWAFWMLRRRDLAVRILVVRPHIYFDHFTYSRSCRLRFVTSLRHGTAK